MGKNLCIYVFALEKLTMSTTKAHLQMKTRQQHSDERPNSLTFEKSGKQYLTTE
jgi:hypothetical protein